MLESLERRTLLAAVAVGETYFSDAPMAGTVRTVATIDGVTYFGVATADAINFSSRSQLWRTDGTAGGSQKIADLQGILGYAPTSYPFPVSNFTAAGSFIYFTVADSPTSSELWKTDGTAGGTTLVRDMPAFYSNQPVKNHQLTAFNGKVYFLGSTLSGTSFTWELYVSEGSFNAISSKPGTVMDMTVFNDAIYIATTSGLWRSTGGVASQITTTAITSNLEVFNGALHFGTAQGLFRSNGTAGGTTLVSTPGQLASPNNLRAAATTLFFAGTQSGFGSELWKSDGTAGGTMMVRDIVSGANSSSPAQLTAHDDTIYFVTNGELWSSDGSEAGTVQVKDIVPGSGASSPADLTVFDGQLYFTAFTSTHGRELWRSDGSENGTERVTDMYAGAGSGVPSILESGPTGLYVGAVDAGAGYGLYRLTEHDASPTAVKDLYAGGLNMQVPHAVTDSGTMFFVGGHSQPHAAELYRIDGSGSALVRDIVAGLGTPAIDIITALADRVVFTATTFAAGEEIWASDGTFAGTAMLKDIYPGRNSSDTFRMVSHRGHVYFNATDGVSSDIWRTDGTPGGTAKWSTIDNFHGWTTIGDWLYVTTGGILWRTNGVVNETVKVFDSASSQALNTITAIDGKLYFNVNKTFSGHEAWTSDGTAAGTTLIKSFPYSTGGFVGGSGWVLFSTLNMTVGWEIWRTNGTPAGTMRMQDVPGMPQAAWAHMGARTSGFGKAIFAATDAPHGQELWISDGTAAGTHLLKDITPGPGSSDISFVFVECGDYVYFIADDGVHGRELWVTDGTTAGTFMVADMYPGPEGSAPANLTDDNGTLWFTASDGVSSKWFKLAPPTASAGGAYAVSGDWQVTLQASASNLDAAESHNFSWDLDGDGVFGETGADAGRGDEVGANPVFDAAGLSGGSFAIAVRATDSVGLSHTSAGVVHVGTLPITLGAGGRYALSGGVLRIGGSATATGDLGAGDDDVEIVAEAASQVLFASSQRVRSLRLGDGASVAVAPLGTHLLALRELDIADDATLDLRDNLMLIDYEAENPPGAWDRNRVITSEPAAQGAMALKALGVAEAAQAMQLTGAATASWHGPTVDATTLLIAFTDAGDADLNRRIDADDYFWISAGYVSGRSGYQNGDFDGNGSIDGDDYWLIDTNYGMSQGADLLRRPGGEAQMPASAMTRSSGSLYQRLIDDDEDVNQI